MLYQITNIELTILYEHKDDGDTLSIFSPKEKVVVYAFREGLKPSKLILDRSGDNLFNTEFGIYGEVSPIIFNFLRNDEEDYQLENQYIDE